MLQRRSVPVASLINIVAGVSLAILDSDRNVGRPHATSTIFVAYISLMQRNLRSVGTHADGTDMTISVDHAIALAVDAVGLMAGADAHLNMRAVEALNPMLASFPTARFTSSGTVAKHLASGVRALLNTNSPTHLRDRLRTEALRLTPAVESGRAR